MNKNLTIILITFSICFSAGLYQKESLIVKFDAGLNHEYLTNILDSYNCKLEKLLVRKLNIWLVNFNPDEFQSNQHALNRITQLEDVIYAQFDHYVTQRLIPNDPDFNQMWDMNNTGQTGGQVDADIDAPEAWEITTGGITALGDEIVVAVVDGGVQTSHTDLSENIWVNENEIPGNGVDDDNNGYVDDINGWDAYANDGSIPSDSHGTHVAGTVGAVGDNGNDVVGVNWNVKIMSVAGSTSQTSVISIAYGYVLDQKTLWLNTQGDFGANVVATNSSFGIDFADCNSGSYPVWNDLYDAMGEVGILSAAATINSNQNVDNIGDVPTGCNSDFMVSVTNTTDDDVKYSSAGYGAETIDLGAPGTNICSTVPNNSVSCSYTGTSMATPHVAGAIGFLHAAASSSLAQLCIDDPANCALTLKQTLLDNVDPLPSLNGISVSGGRLNLYQSAMSISGPQPELEISTEVLTYNLNQDQTEIDNITLSNIGEPESILNFSIEKTPFNNTGGGSDELLYWSDSDIEVEIGFEWLNIAGDAATQISFPTNDLAGQPITIPFEFPFFGADGPYYGTPYTQCIVNPNGWIGFMGDSGEWDNTNIPSQNAPLNAIFAFWDDLNPVNDNCNEYCSGDVWYYGDNEKFIVWFNNVAHWWSDGFEDSFFNFQIVLYPTGKIQFNYAEIIGNYSATIGFQNSEGTSGVSVNFNGDYVHNSLSTSFLRSPEWLSINPLEGVINQGESFDVSVQVSSNELNPGDYGGYVKVNSNGGSETAQILLTVSEFDPVLPGDVNLDGEVNVIDVVLIVNFILGEIIPDPIQFSAGDLNEDGEINVLDIVSVVNIILQE